MGNSNFWGKTLVTPHKPHPINPTVVSTRGAPTWDVFSTFTYRWPHTDVETNVTVRTTTLHFKSHMLGPVQLELRITWWLYTQLFVIPISHGGLLTIWISQKYPSSEKCRILHFSDHSVFFDFTEKYDRQVWKPSPRFGVKIKNIWNHPPSFHWISDCFILIWWLHDISSPYNWNDLWKCMSFYKWGYSPIDHWKYPASKKSRLKYLISGHQFESMCLISPWVSPTNMEEHILSKERPSLRQSSRLKPAKNEQLTNPLESLPEN